MLLLVLIKVTSMVGTCESNITPITIYHVSNCEKKKKMVVLLRELARFCFFSPMNYSFWAIFLFGLADVLVVWHLLLDKIGFVIFLSLIVGLLDFEWAPFSE